MLHKISVERATALAVCVNILSGFRTLLSLVRC